MRSQGRQEATRLRSHTNAFGPTLPLVSQSRRQSTETVPDVYTPIPALFYTPDSDESDRYVFVQLSQAGARISLGVHHSLVTLVWAAGCIRCRSLLVWR